MNLDKNSFEPLYYQLQEIIKEKINNKEYQANDLIPSETELCKTYGVSRITVRKAIMDLVQKGILYRERGLGTFVSESPEPSNLKGVHGFTEEILKLNQRPSAKLLECKIKKPTIYVSKKLNISKDDLVIAIKRLRSVDDKPYFSEIIYFPYLKVYGIEKENLENSIYSILNDKFKLKIVKAIETLEPVILDEFEGKMLKVKPSSAGLRVERIGYINDNEIIEYSMHIVRGDKCKYSIERTSDVNGK